MDLNDERAKLWQALHTIDDRVTEAHSALEDMPNKISRAVVEGNIATVRSPEFWAALFAGFQKNTKESAGGFLFGGIRRVLSGLGWVIILGIALWVLGGPGAVITAIKAAAGSQ